jgi:methyl-accepting chemotaxis protein
MMKWFMNVNTSIKMILAFLFISFILAGVGFYSLHQLSVMKQNLNELYDNNLISIKSLSMAGTNFQKLRVAVRDISNATTKEDKDNAAAKIPDIKKEIFSHMDTYRAVNNTPVEAELLKTLDEEWAEYEKHYEKAIQLANQNDRNPFIAYLPIMAKVGFKAEDTLDKLISINVELATKQDIKSEIEYSHSRNTTIVIIIIAFLLSLVMGLAIGQMIAIPLKKLVGIVAKVADGDLREKSGINTKDEIGYLAKSINQMVDSLRSVLVEVGHSSSQLAASAEQLSASSEQSTKASEHIAGISETIADSANHQVHSVEENAQTVHDVSAKIQQIAANAQSVSATTSKAAEKSSEGGRAIQTAVEQMNAISGSVEGLAQVITQLEDASQEISQITEVITQIAQQTNLLSLNAAIEAARSGEHGRGFAVVAGEVKKLAEQSSSSTEQISALILAVRDKIGMAQASMHTATNEVNLGMEVVHAAGSLFSEIALFVDEVNGRVLEVSEASQQIASGSEQVVQSFEGISRLAQTTASGTQNVSAATEEQLASMQEISSSSIALTQMAEELQQLVEKFKM